MANFVWGEGGAQMTPEQIAAQRKVAQALMEKGMDYSPIQSPWQGAARVAQALMGGFESGQADSAAAKNAAADREMISGLLGGGTTPPAAPVSEGPSAQPMGNVAIPQGKEEFVSTLMPMAEEASKRTGVDPRIIVAQAALESGWGKSAPGNNLFGIKSHGEPGGNVMPTTEVVNGQPVRTTDSFRAYGSPAESVNGYADFITKNPRYRPMREAQGLDAQVAALGQSGYATDPQYGNKVGSIARALPGTDAPMQVAQAQPTRSPLSGVNPKVIEAVTSPYASPQTKAIANIILQQQMKQDGATDEIKEYNLYSRQEQTAGRQPKTFFDFKTDLKKAGAQSINIDQKQESEYQKATGKQFAEANMDIIKSAGAARGKIATLNRLGTMLGDPSMYTGKAGESVLELKRLGKAIGIDVGDVGPAEAVKSISSQFALELRNPSGGAGMPGAMSDKDREFLQSMVPGLGQNPQGNALIIDYMKRVAQRSVDVERLRQQYVRKNGRLDEGFYNELADYSDAHQIFSEGDMKNAAPVVPQGGQNIDDLLRKYGGTK